MNETICTLQLLKPGSWLVDLVTGRDLRKDLKEARKVIRTFRDKPGL